LTEKLLVTTVTFQISLHTTQIAVIASSHFKLNTDFHDQTQD
jgi:hypothetical protein